MITDYFDVSFFCMMPALIKIETVVCPAKPKKIIIYKDNNLIENKTGKIINQ